jgi:hypothetical protein
LYQEAVNILIFLLILGHFGQDIFNTAAQVSRHKLGHVDVIILKVKKSFDLLKPDCRCVFHGLYSDI